jgi:hypothetical protein
MRNPHKQASAGVRGARLFFLEFFVSKTAHRMCLAYTFWSKSEGKRNEELAFAHHLGDEDEKGAVLTQVESEAVELEQLLLFN